MKKPVKYVEAMWERPYAHDTDDHMRLSPVGQITSVAQQLTLMDVIPFTEVAIISLRPSSSSRSAINAFRSAVSKKGSALSTASMRCRALRWHQTLSSSSVDGSPL